MIDQRYIKQVCASGCDQNSAAVLVSNALLGLAAVMKTLKMTGVLCFSFVVVIRVTQPLSPTTDAGKNL